MKKMTQMSFDQAVSFFLQGGTGTVVKNDGTREHGPCIDIQDENNDPDGIGYISILVGPSLIHDVYATELAGIEVS